MTERSKQQRAALLEAEITRLQAELVVLERQWSRKHWLGLSILIVIPLAIAQVPAVWILVTLLAAPSLVATQAYLLWVRRRECHDLIAQARRDLERVEAGAPLVRISRA